MTDPRVRRARALRRYGYVQVYLEGFMIFGALVIGFLVVLGCAVALVF